MTRRLASVRTSGLEHMPEVGPVVLAAGHVHHLYDGCTVMATVARPLHLMAALDWARPGLPRRALAAACAAARWPAVIRPESVLFNPLGGLNQAERWPRLRQAAHLAVELLARGRALLIFPEGYPQVDPRPTPRLSHDSPLPFHPGFAHIAWRAGRRLGRSVPIVPVGIRYEGSAPMHVQIQLGAPMTLASRDALPELVEAISYRVLDLSQ